MKRLLHLAAFALALTFTANTAAAKCNARFLNPITEVCWDCIFPISVGALSINLGAVAGMSRNSHQLERTTL